MAHQSVFRHGLNVGISVCFASFPIQMGISYDREKSFALSVTREAFDICARAPRSRVHQKQDRSPVTVADLAIQACATQALQRTFATDCLIGEEDASELSADDTSLWLAVNNLAGFDAQDILLSASGARLDVESCSRYWALDPIDGTKGFINDEAYAIGLALLNQSKDNGPTNVTQVPIVAALGIPAQGYILLADVRAGVLDKHYIDNGCADRRIQDVHQENMWMLSGATNLSLQGWPQWTPRCCGSLIKYAAVAQSEAQAFVQVMTSQQAHVWDHAAGVAAVVASGGCVTDEFGGPVHLGHGPRRSIVQLQECSRAIVATACGVDHLDVCRQVAEALKNNSNEGTV